jgi:hypothetical protein
MAIQWLRELGVWWDSLAPSMTFFFTLPFLIAAAGLLAQQYRKWRANRHPSV